MAAPGRDGTRLPEAQHASAGRNSASPLLLLLVLHLAVQGECRAPTSRIVCCVDRVAFSDLIWLASSHTPATTGQQSSPNNT